MHGDDRSLGKFYGVLRPLEYPRYSVHSCELLRGLRAVIPHSHDIDGFEGIDQRHEMIGVVGGSQQSDGQLLSCQDLTRLSTAIRFRPQLGITSLSASD
jgi:hypothetical protein